LKSSQWYFGMAAFLARSGRTCLYVSSFRGMREVHEPGIHTPQRLGLWIPGSRAKSPRPGMTYQ